MSDSELDHLKKMANQIAANFSFHDDQVARIADHITRFWAPSMRKLLGEYIANGGDGIDESVRQAVKNSTSA